MAVGVAAWVNELRALWILLSEGLTIEKTARSQLPTEENRGLKI